jgi:glucuronoarabinoxylan endo-1,4-beta-xylanase
MANEIALMRLAQAREARVWSTPWTPQASFKDNNNTIGGNFVSANNQAYANQLAGYVAQLAASGIQLYALSIQNEPDANVSYVSCHWSPQQFHDFIPYLYNALVASNVSSTKIMLPESQSCCS